MEVMRRAEGAARLGRWVLGERRVPTPCVMSWVFPGAPAGEVHVAPAWVRTSRRPLVVHHGVLRSTSLRGGGELGLLPQASARLSSFRGVVERWAEGVLALGEAYPESGVMLDGWHFPELWRRVAERFRSRCMLGIAHAGELCTKPRLLVTAVTEVRELASTGTVLYLPGVPPHFMPLLALMGVDVFDDAYAAGAALSGIYLSPAGEHHLRSLGELPCRCPECRSAEEGSRMSLRALLRHNIGVVRSMLAEVRAAMRQRRLCELAEAQANLSVEAKAALRVLYRERQDFLQRYHPVA